jgi:myo-inositol-1(or 4)-monophosphatase
MTEPVVGRVPGSDVDLVALASETAREAGRLVVRMREEGVSVAGTKSSPIDVVTEADRACEELIRERLLGARPTDGFIGEEGDDIAGTSGIQWIVDPIDGTVNYLYGMPHYAVSIAAARGDEVVAGVVLSPVTGVEYAATLGAGATCNGVDIEVRRPPALGQALIGTGFGYETEVRTRQGEAVSRMLPEVRDIRRQGSCALDLCAVAAGQLDGYVEEGPHIWDYAAGGLIAIEAGATLEIWTSVVGHDVVVCAPALGWSDFSGLVRACGFLGGDTY